MGVGKKIAVYAADKLACGTFFTAAVKELLKLEPAEITRLVVLESERVQVKLKHPDGKLVGYTVSVNITRDPITEDESNEVAKFVKDVASRKTERDTKDESERRRAIDTAYAYGKDGVVSALASLKDIAPAIKVLNDIQRSVTAD